MRRTKIVCTLGPATATPEMIEGMLKAGLNVARLNFSHGTHESHGEMIDLFRSVRDRLGMPAAVMLDTKGPEIRIGEMEDGTVLKEGSLFTLTTEPVTGNSQRAFINYLPLPSRLKCGDIILLDDGLLRLEVREITGNEITCRVLTGGVLKTRKGVNIPGADLGMPFMSDSDRSDLLFGIEKDVDFIAASFVRCREDVLELRAFLDAHGGERIRIISKIENLQGIRNFDEILEVTDGIMVARGDMGVEIDFQYLPGIQIRMIQKCFQTGKMVICATQMLESMTENITPTRAEITDVANAVFEGTCAVMTSGETASGQNPVLVVQTMAKITEQAELDAVELASYRNMVYSIDHSDRTNALCDAAATTARDLDAAAVIALTLTGSTARNVSKFRPTAPIIAAATDPKVFHQLSLGWGIVPVLAEPQASSGLLLEHAVALAKGTGLVKDGDTVVLTAGFPLNTEGKTNMIRVETL